MYILLIALLSINSFITNFRQILPFVQHGSVITVINAEPNYQTVRVLQASGITDYMMYPYEVLRVKSVDAGNSYVLIESNKTAVHAYASVNGTTIPGQTLNTYVRLLRVSRFTGIAISNPWDVNVNLTFELHMPDQLTISSTTAIGPGKSIVDFAGNIMILPNTPVSMHILSSMPIGVAAAECIAHVCETVPVRAVGVKEVGPLN